MDALQAEYALVLTDGTLIGYQNAHELLDATARAHNVAAALAALFTMRQKAKALGAHVTG